MLQLVTSVCLTMSEKLCLNWNDFQENLNAAFTNLREDREFADVTLACEDGQQIEAHKVILAASSPFLQNLLRRNKHPHPLIYLRGIKSENLVAMVDFLYCGVANVYQENLDAFLSLAEEFELKGLMGQNNYAKEEEKTNLTSKEVTQTTQMRTKHFVEKSGHFQGSPRNNVKYVFKEDGPTSESDQQSVALATFETGDLQELDEKVKSMMEKSQNKISSRGRADICKICGKEGQWVAIRDHIEANHLEGISLPCNICGRVSKSRWSLRNHKAKHHQKLPF